MTCFGGRANRTYRDLAAGHEGKKGVEMAPGFWPGVPYNEMREAS